MKGIDDIAGHREGFPDSGARQPVFLARYGLSNRISAIIECVCTGRGSVCWAINDHCRLAPSQIFGRDLFSQVEVVCSPVPWPNAGIDSFLVSPCWPVERVREAARFVLDHFLPDFEPQEYSQAIHFRGLAHGEHCAREFARSAAAVLRPGEVFVLADSQRDELVAEIEAQGFAPVILPSSPPMAHDYDRHSVDAQLAFCRDLKTLWAAGVLMANTRSTMADMRAFLGYPTYRPANSQNPWTGKSWASQSRTEIEYLPAPG